MKTSTVLLVLLPTIWLIGCAGVVPPLEQDPNVVTLFFKDGDKVPGRILDIQGEVIRFKPDYWVVNPENPHFNEFIRADELKFIQLPSGSRFTFKEFVDYRWTPKSPVTLTQISANGVTKAGQNGMTKVTADQDLQYEQLKQKAIAEMTPNEFQYFMLMKEQEVKAQPQNQPAQANGVVTKTDSARVTSSTLSLTPRVEPKVSKEEEAIKEIASFLVEAELAGPLIEAVRLKKEQAELLTLYQLLLVKAVTDMPAWKQRQDDLRNFSAVAEQAMAHVYLYAPDSLSQHLGLRFDANAEMDFRDLMEQLHQRFGAAVTMGDFRLLVATFEEDGARAMREILNHYTDWRFAVDNIHPLYSKNFGR